MNTGSYVVENTDGVFVASFATKLLADFFVEEGSGCYRHRLSHAGVSRAGDVTARAREIAIKYALPGQYDGTSTYATRRGDADDRPYMLALIAALSTPPPSSAGVAG